MKRFWLIVSGVCGGTALFFLLRHDFDKAFIVAAVGALAWFLNYRRQMKELVTQAEDAENRDDSLE